MKRVSTWLKPDGRLFVQILCHREFAYPMVLKSSTSETDFVAQFFFTGGTMPSSDLLLYFQKDVQIEKMWMINGAHYQRTLDAWLELQDQQKEEIMKVFKRSYGSNAIERFDNFRKFFMYTSKTFGYRGGNEWIVAQYLFSKNHRSSL
jgi:cyclopropane-fatty-acyl-phospholipid synthase